MSLPWLVRESLLYPMVRAGLAGLVIAAVLLVSAAGYMLTSRTALKVSRAEAASLEQSREHLLRNIEQAHQIKAREKELTELRRKLERQTGANEIMGGLQALAEASGVRIIEQRIANIGVGPPGMIRTQMALEGSYAGIRRYLAAIPGRMPVLTAVGSVRMKPGTSGRAVAAELELLSYTGNK